MSLKAGRGLLGPSNSEIEASPLLHEVTDVLDAFLAESSTQKKINTFAILLDLFHKFVEAKQVKSIQNFYIPFIAKEIFKFVQFIFQDVSLLIKTIQTLCSASKYVNLTCEYQDLSVLAVGSFLAFPVEKKIVEIASPLFVHLLSDKDIFTDFVNSGGLHVIFNSVFVDLKMKELVEFTSDLFFAKIPVQNYQNCPYDAFFTSIVGTISEDIVPEELRYEAGLFIANLFQIMSRYNKQLSKYASLSLFAAFECLIGPHVSAFRPMLLSCNDNMSPAPNLTVYIRLHQIHLRAPEHQKSILEMIASIDSDHLEVLEERLPISVWFSTSVIPLEDMMYIIKTLDTKNHTIAASCVKSLLPRLKLDNLTKDCIKLIGTQVNRKLLSNEDLFSFGFFDMLLLNTDDASLARLFEVDQSFTTIVACMIPLIRNRKTEELIFTKVFNLIDKVNSERTFSMIGTSLLSQSPQPENIKILINAIDRVRNPHFVRIFQALFMNVPESARSFVKIKGVNWLLESDYITRDVYVDVLSSVVYTRRFEEVEDYIENLPPDHKLLQISMIELEKIVYGMNTSHYRPIRVRALAHLVKIPEYVDPFNAWMLASPYVDYHLARGKEIWDVPHITEIANRYVPGRFVSLLLEKPLELQKYCDPSYDHFPVFQLFPGQMPLVFKHSYVAVSFWFKFKDLTTKKSSFVKTDAVSIGLQDTHMTISVDHEKHIIEVNPCEWNYVKVTLDSNLISTNVDIVVQGNSYSFASKYKGKKFTFLSFASTGNTLVFLGSAIRFYSQVVQKDTVFEHGPGFLKRTHTEAKTVTPYFINHPNKDIYFEKPPTCVSVPYFGLPMHFMSMRTLIRMMTILSEAKTQSEFTTMYQALIDINKITRYKPARFWSKLMEAIKKCEQFLSKKIFLDGLVSMSIQQERERILSSILFDSDMWKIVNNEILVDCLFEHFSDINWSKIEDFELFMANVVIDNPESKEILLVIFRNHEKLPKLIGYIIALLKVAPSLRHKTCPWDSLEFREEVLIQSTIINALIDYTTKDTVDWVTSIFKMSDFKGLFIVSTTKLRVELFHLLTHLTQLKHDYFTCDRVILSSIVTLSHKQEVWDDAFQLARNGCTEAYSVILILVWAAAVCYVHRYQYGLPSDEGHFDMIIKYMNDGIAFCNSVLSTILSSNDGLAVLLGWYPSILYYETLFREVPDIRAAKESEITTATVSQFSERQENLWIGAEHVVKDFSFPKPKKPSLPGQFMLETVSTVLTENGFAMNFRSDYVRQPISEWLSDSSLLHFLANIALSAPAQSFGNIMHALFFSFFFISNHNRKDPYAPVLLHTILRSLSCDSNVPMSQLLNYTHVIVGLNLVNEISLIIMNDVFTVAANLCERDRFVKHASSIHAILLLLFQGTAITVYDNLFKILTERAQLLAQIILSQKALHCWLYTFVMPSVNSRKFFNPFFRKFVSFLEISAKDRGIVEALSSNALHVDEALPMLESSWKAKLRDVQAGYQSIYKTVKDTASKFPLEIGCVSRDVTKEKYITTARHYLIAHLFSHSLAFLNSRFRLLEEKAQWARVINQMRDKDSEISKFKPESFHLAPQCLPFTAPTLLTPSPFKRGPLSESKVIRIFRKNIKFLYSSTHNLHVNMLNLFVKLHADRYGTPKFVIPCEVIRYLNPIKSVLFVYQSAYLILTFTQLTENENDISMKYAPDTYQLHVFLESLFLGHWGNTTVFGSKVVIILPKENVIHMHLLNENSLNLWSFSAGSFIVRMRKRNITQVMNDMPATTFPATPFLFNIKTIEEARRKYVSGEISAAQALCVFNCLSGRSFSDLERYPIFPYVYERDWETSLFESFPAKDTIQSMLANCAPFDSFAKPSFVFKTDLPATFYYSAEFWSNIELPVSISEQICNLRRIAESPETMDWAARAFNITGDVHRTETRVRWIAELDRVQLPQKLTFDGSGGLVYYSTGETLIKLPVLSTVANDLPWMAAVLDRDLFCLSFINVKTGQVYYRKYSHMLVFAKEISFAANGLMLSVDYKFGMTRVYRIFYKDGIPDSIKTCSIFAWDSKASSKVSGSDWLIASMCGRELTLWNVFSATVHRVVRLDDVIVAMAFDETVNSIWIMTETKGVFMTVNGTILADIKMEEKVTTMKVVRLPREESRRSAILGTQSGGIYLVAPKLDTKTVELKKLASPHTCAIRKISIHSSNKVFVSVSRDGLVCSWNAQNLESPRLGLDVIHSCCQCDKPATKYCVSCNRGICSACGATLCRECYE